jgi:hypothetical protein
VLLFARKVRPFTKIKCFYKNDLLSLGTIELE